LNEGNEELSEDVDEAMGESQSESEAEEEDMTSLRGAGGGLLEPK
jgi:hypothetical protein